MIDEKLITQFIPARAIESPLNTHPYARVEDKIRAAMRRFLSNNSFTDGIIADDAPRLLILKNYFDPQKMGYDVIARIL